MSAIWDGDTGTVTITATTASGAVNLTGADCTVIARMSGGAAVELAITSSNLPAGTVVANASALDPGDYMLVLRAVTGGVTATYPSADKGPEVLSVVADLDAPA